MTTVEFALVFPILVGFIFMIIDGGRFIGARLMLANAAGIGARTAALGSTTTTATVDSAVQSASPMLPGLSVAAPVCLRGPGPAFAAPCIGGWTAKVPRDRIAVTVNYTFSASFFNFLSKPLSQQSWVVVE